MPDIVSETAVRIGTSPNFIFRRAVESQHFSNEIEIVDRRISDYYRTGAIPDYVRHHCEQLQKAVQLAEVHNAASRRATG